VRPCPGFFGAGSRPAVVLVGQCLLAGAEVIAATPATRRERSAVGLYVAAARPRRGGRGNTVRHVFLSRRAGIRRRQNPLVLLIHGPDFWLPD